MAFNFQEGGSVPIEVEPQQGIENAVCCESIKVLGLSMKRRGENNKRQTRLLLFLGGELNLPFNRDFGR